MAITLQTQIPNIRTAQPLVKPAAQSIEAPAKQAERPTEPAKPAFTAAAIASQQAHLTKYSGSGPKALGNGEDTRAALDLLNQRRKGVSNNLSRNSYTQESIAQQKAKDRNPITKAA